MTGIPSPALQISQVRPTKTQKVEYEQSYPSSPSTLWTRKRWLLELVKWKSRCCQKVKKFRNGIFVSRIRVASWDATPTLLGQPVTELGLPIHSPMLRCTSLLSLFSWVSRTEMLQPPPPSAPILPLSLISLALQLTKKPSIPAAGGVGGACGCGWVWSVLPFLIWWMEEEGLLVSVAFGRGGVCSKSWGRGSSNPGGEGEKETGGGGAAGNGAWKGQEEGTRTVTRGWIKGTEAKTCALGHANRRQLWWKGPKVADAIRCLKGSLAKKVSLGIDFWQTTRSSVILLQNVSGRLFVITGLFTLMFFFFPFPEFLYLYNPNTTSTW